MSVIPPRSSDFLAGSSLGFVKPMPQRGSDPRVDQGDSAEFDVGMGGQSAQIALELWRRLLPDSANRADASFACAGLMLGHFRVEEQIGRGGMGAVFRAVDTRLDREVALKVLAGTQSNDKSAVDRFLNEARSAARLDHDNVARVFFVGEDHGLHFIAFEFIHGSNVRQVIDARGSLPPAEAVNYTLQIAHALRHIDDAGVVHRDVKPSNIIITPTGRAKLVDLGLARKVDPEASRDLTVDGTTLGTFDYISPEQAKDPRSVDIRSDIYSLGCTLYHMLTGEPPYPRGTMLQKLLDHQHKDVPDASARNSAVPPELSAVVRKMMASDPGDRYQSADELIGDLTILAHAYGLRPVASDAHIWAVPRRVSGWRVLRQYRAWIATAALLVAGVLAIDFAQSMAGRSKTNPDSAQMASSESPPAPSTDGLQAPLTAPPVTPETGALSPGWPEGTGTGLEVSGDSDSVKSLITDDFPTASSTTNSPSRESPVVTVPIAGALGAPAENSIALDVPLLSSDPQLLSTDSTNDSVDQDDAADVTTNHEDATTADGAGAGEATLPSLSAEFIVRADGEPVQEFVTLDAACSAAPDGSVIELNFDGPSLERQRPIRIEGKRLRLRRGPGRTPIIRFAHPREWTSAQIVRMISVIRGSLEVYDVGFDFSVDPKFITTHGWVLLSLSQAEEVVLRGVSVTIHNPQMQPAALVELAEPTSRFDNRMPDAMDRPPVRFDAEDSLFRGQADLFLCDNVDPARVRLSNVAAALSGSIIRLRGMDAIDVLTDMNNEHRIEMDLRHVTALLGKEVVLFDIEPGREVPRVAVSADNSVLVNSGSPIVSMTGEVDAYESRQLLEWSGGHSYIEAQDPVWHIAGPIDEVDYDLAEWNDLWRHGHLERAVGTNLLPRDRSIPFDQMTRNDLALIDGAVEFNPARAGASDGTDAGVQWESTRLPRILDSPGP